MKGKYMTEMTKEEQMKDEIETIQSELESIDRYVAEAAESVGFAINAADRLLKLLKNNKNENN